MSMERWDVVIALLGGPLAAKGEMVFPGPVVRLGANPGAGGLELVGYRGLDERQAVITTYKGQPSIEPVGTAQVRIAPHEHVDWEKVQPLRSSAMLTPNCAVHLGRPGRGATLRFVDCRELGAWETGSIEVVEQVGPVPELSPENVITADQGVPKWFVAGLLVIAMAVLGGIGLPIISSLMRDSSTPRPVRWIDSVNGQVESVDVNALDLEMLDGLDKAWMAFVVAPNSDLADRPELRDRDKWDDRLLMFTSTQVRELASVWNFWKRLDDVREDYAHVVGALGDAGLPSALAAIPYQESQYNRRGLEDSPACAKSWWMFMPEVAHRVGLEVSNCTIEGREELWTPTNFAAPPQIYRYAAYTNHDLYERIQAGNGSMSRWSDLCLMRGCQVDERVDLHRSTTGAITLLGDTWREALVRDSGSAVQIVIAAHNRGWDDSMYPTSPARRSPGNLHRTYVMWKQRHPDVDTALFVGEQIRCNATPQWEQSTCDTALPPETQHYVYNVLAQHFLAVCYYARNYPDSFPSEWDQHIDGYCQSVEVPSTAQVVDESSRHRSGR